MKRGPYKNRKEQHEKARALRNQGLTLTEIGKTVSVPPKTIHNWTKDIPFDPGGVQKRGNPTKPFEDLTSKKAIRRRLVDKNGWCCSWCGRSEWMGYPIPLELHTGDEVPEVLCPNCHAMTPDWRRKKK